MNGASIPARASGDGADNNLRSQEIYAALGWMLPPTLPLRCMLCCRTTLLYLVLIWSAQAQTWHSDNRSRGLTIIVPLVDFTIANGAAVS